MTTPRNQGYSNDYSYNSYAFCKTNFYEGVKKLQAEVIGLPHYLSLEVQESSKLKTNLLYVRITSFI